MEACGSATEYCVQRQHPTLSWSIPESLGEVEQPKAAFSGMDSKAVGIYGVCIYICVRTYSIISKWAVRFFSYCALISYTKEG